MTLRVRILGSGSSGGVPRIGGHWGACDPAEPRNRRRRCSILVQRLSGGESTDVLVDTSPDLREQMLDAGLGRLDAVLYTHQHADQVSGIDDLRVIAINMRTRVPVYMDQVTNDVLTKRFDYCFEAPKGSPYPPILDARPMTCLEPVSIAGAGGDVVALPFDQDHGVIRSLGFRFGPVAYSPDVVDIPEESFEALEGVECWIVDALRYTPHMTHAHVDKALEWIDRVRPKRAYLTNLHVDLDYRTLAKELPEGVEPAYDGLELDFEI
jgi:phosphoribosyl 1,2-cyclic phosphate phosphodiesterase